MLPGAVKAVEKPSQMQDMQIRHEQKLLQVFKEGYEISFVCFYRQLANLKKPRQI